MKKHAVGTVNGQESAPMVPAEFHLVQGAGHGLAADLVPDANDGALEQGVDTFGRIAVCTQPGPEIVPGELIG